jgi:4-amino-4-deoxychorismate lyase
MWLVNGEPGDSVAIGDRGLAYGDGLFETMAWVDGQVRGFDRHWHRLASGCTVLGIPLPDEACVKSEIQRVASASPCVVKLLVTRGESGRGYAPDPAGRATRMVGSFPWPRYPERCRVQGVTVGVANTRLAVNPQLAGLKHLNRLEQVMGARERQANSWDEALMLDYRGHVIGGTMSNLFGIINGTLTTPCLADSGIRGVMREGVLAAAARNGIPTASAQMNLETLAGAEELFLTNALIGVWPVAALADRRWQPGQVTRLLMEKVT